MCTSLSYTDTQNQHYFARTMDFPTTTPWRPIFLPRGYDWPTGVNTMRQTRYAILGGGRLPTHFASYLMADGINEYGLSCAELYLPHAVNYQVTGQPGKINLTPQGFINWVLGEHANVKAVLADLPRICLVAGLWGGDDQVYPFHWFLTDQMGGSVVIEPTTNPLIATTNPAGVLTNTPVLARHLQNLGALLDCPGTADEATLREAAHQWLATHASLPTGSIPTKRFLNVALKRLGTPVLTPSAVPMTLFNWLRGVSLPYDARRRNQISHNYTHYRALINLNQKSYTFWSRTRPQPRTLELTTQMANDWQIPFVFES